MCSECNQFLLLLVIRGRKEHLIRRHATNIHMHHMYEHTNVQHEISFEASVSFVAVTTLAEQESSGSLQ